MILQTAYAQLVDFLCSSIFRRFTDCCRLAAEYRLSLSSGFQTVLSYVFYTAFMQI